MISYYQPHLFPFLTLKPNVLPPNIFRHYYLSWEDAFWEILPQLGIQKGSTILLPDFFCIDVIENMENHEYKVAYYPLDHNFQISSKQFDLIYKLIKPSVVVLFHACGITNKLTQNKSFIQRLAAKSLVIEDNVHKILDINRIKILHDRHLIIDSLRKNIPLPGSFVYTSKSTWSKLKAPYLHSVIDLIKVLVYYLVYRLLLSLGVIVRSNKLVKYAHHTVLKTHDDLVGDSIEGNSGLPWIPYLHKHINLSKVRTQKIKQVNYYHKQLKPLAKSSRGITVPNFDLRDFGELHAFPIIIDLPLAHTIEDALISINVWSKFEDCPWSKNKRVFFLPLGFHITVSDQRLITSTIIKSLQKH